VNEREEIARSLLVARGDGAKALQGMEEGFDEVALAIEPSNESGFDLALGLGMDDGLHAACAHRREEIVGVVPSVADESLASRVREEFLCGDHLVALPRRERDVDRTALGVDDGVEFG